MGLNAWEDTGLSGKGCCTTSFESARATRMLYAEMPSAKEKRILEIRLFSPKQSPFLIF